MVFNLYFTIEKFVITPNARYTVPVYNRTYVYANFKFSSEWDSLAPIAIFVKDEESYQVPLEFNRCIVPAEVMDSLGTVNVGVIAGDMAVSNVATFAIGNSIYQLYESVEGG